jgi:hypothetical protein
LAHALGADNFSGGMAWRWRGVGVGWRVVSCVSGAEDFVWWRPLFVRWDGGVRRDKWRGEWIWGGWWIDGRVGGDVEWGHV